MYGIGLIKGLGVTIKHFLETYVDDLRWLGRGRYYNEDALKIRQSTEARGVFTVQYPEEKLSVPEEFRYIPFLVYEENPDGTREDRCTSCGICSKVCPPQCIWIVRSNDPETGRPIPAPTEFYIDIDICMNCGLCAEYCPFDAIKMDHVYELASYERSSAHIYNKERLSKPASYYAEIRPKNYAREEAARAEKEALKAAKKKKE
ncbi:MAG: 4Fe-4S dicluster domain-containing protein [Anaerolineales bacterium]|jgi:NADH-quinone oxidoreductase subunit I|nr:MAG: 4Fe-4S dicluster domain-containing protein [Anaerolineales bacterium]